MKRILLVCGLSLCCAVYTAQAQNDPKAKAVLESVSKKMNGYKSMKANFSLTLTGGKGGKVTDSKKGTFALKGQKYHILLSGQEIICDGKTVWTYNKEAKEVQVSNFNPSEQSFSPAKLFTPDFYDKDYRCSYKGEKKVKGKSCDIVELVPTDKSKNLAKIELTIDKGTSMITGGDYSEKNGNKYHIEVSGFTPNAAVADNYFTWVPKEHPGVEVVDLR